MHTTSADAVARGTRRVQPCVSTPSYATWHRLWSTKDRLCFSHWPLGCAARCRAQALYWRVEVGLAWEWGKGHTLPAHDALLLFHDLCGRNLLLNCKWKGVIARLSSQPEGLHVCWAASYLCAKRQATFVQATFVQNGTPQLLFYTPYCTPHKPYIFEVQKQCTGWWLIVSDVSILSFALPIQGKRRSLPSAQHRPTVRHRTGSFPWSSNNPCIIWWVHHRIQNSNRILSLVFKWPLHYMLNSPVCAPFLKLHAFFINCFGGLPYQQAPLSLIDVDSCFHCLFSFLTAPKCLFLPYWRWGWFHCLLSFFDGSKMPLSPQLMWGVILPAWFFNGTTMFCSLMIWGLVPLPALRGQWNHCSVTAN